MVLIKRNLSKKYFKKNQSHCNKVTFQNFKKILSHLPYKDRSNVYFSSLHFTKYILGSYNLNSFIPSSYLPCKWCSGNTDTMLHLLANPPSSLWGSNMILFITILLRPGFFKICSTSIISISKYLSSTYSKSFIM